MAKSACPTPKGSEQYGVRGTAWKPMIYISLACLGVTSIISVSLIIQHLRRYRAPKEQRQVIRIIFSVVIYSIVAFFELYSYEIAQYIDPLGDIYEAFGLCALFLLFVQYAAPTGTFDDDTLDAVRSAGENETSFNWPKLAWIFVFQYPIVETLCVAVQEATEAAGTFCLNSLSPRFAHLWIEIIESLSIGACVYCILKFRNQMKKLMKVRRGLSKLACFKIIVFIRFMQQWVFSLLLEYHVIKPSKSYSYNDILYGIPGTATCAEMVLFSLGFWYAYSSTEYSSKAKPGQKPMPIWKAVLDALDLRDFLFGIVRIFPLCIEASRTGDWKKWRAAQREQGVQGAVRKGVRKYKNRKGNKQGNYQELDDDMEMISKPMETLHTRQMSRDLYQDSGYYQMSGGLSASETYQPPVSSPPEDSSSHLMAGTNAGIPGRPRATSQSSLMAESQPLQGRPHSLSLGQFEQDRYGRSRSPSPGRGFIQAPTEGKDMI